MNYSVHNKEDRVNKQYCYQQFQCKSQNYIKNSYQREDADISYSLVLCKAHIQNSPCHTLNSTVNNLMVNYTQYKPAHKPNTQTYLSIVHNYIHNLYTQLNYYKLDNAKYCKPCIESHSNNNIQRRKNTQFCYNWYILTDKNGKYYSRVPLILHIGSKSVVLLACVLNRLSRMARRQRKICSCHLPSKNYNYIKCSYQKNHNNYYIHYYKIYKY